MGPLIVRLEEERPPRFDTLLAQPRLVSQGTFGSGLGICCSTVGGLARRNTGEELALTFRTRRSEGRVSDA